MAHRRRSRDIYFLRSRQNSAALLQADNFFQPKIPTAGPLAEVAADGAEIANLRRADRVRGLGQSWKIPAHVRIFLELIERDQRADPQAALAV